MEEDQIPINNAGLSILWPFLPQYFERLGFVNNGEFVNEGSRNRAVYLLQYLGYNAIDFPEHMSLLNKILVGMPIDQPSQPMEAITQYEEELSQSLLRGVLNNWEKMGNSSIESLQATFLQREGLMTLGSEYYFLQVEKRGFDILLQSIQWNISVIKFPWMVKELRVEWE